jgi:phage tail sheath protein FI
MGLAPSPARAQIVGIETAVAGFVGEAVQGPVAQPTLVESYSAFVTTFGNGIAGLTLPHLAPAAQAFFQNGGQKLYVVRAASGSDADLIGAPAIGATAATGLHALSEIDEVTLVAIPGGTTNAVRIAMLAECELLADRVCLIDPESRDDVSAVLAERAGLAGLDGFGAMYFPWLETTFGGASVEVPPSAIVAGVIARNDAASGVWDSPAGPGSGQVLGATGLTYAVSSADQELLNPQSVNAIRDFGASGILLFGARTLATNPEFRFLAVRRLAHYIQESLEEGTAYALTQPNDAALWAQVEADATSFLQSLWLAGAFAGATPSEAYFARCDATTMSALDLAERRTILLLGIAPLLPAEFVVLRVVQQRAAAAAVPLLSIPALVGLAMLLAAGGGAAIRVRSQPDERHSRPRRSSPAS